MDGIVGFGFCGVSDPRVGVFDAFEVGVFQNRGVVDLRGGPSGDDDGGCVQEGMKNAEKRCD
jgi:hypothetical protein